MKIALCVIALLFALLHGFAAAVQLLHGQRRLSHLLMLVGAVGLAVGAVLGLMGSALDALLAAAGCAMIIAAALANGRQQGKIHPAHHILRGGIALALIVGFILL